MDHVFTIAEERLNLFARMANSACGLSLWCFGMKKQLYTCTCPAEKEFRLFLDLGQCLDYAISKGAWHSRFPGLPGALDSKQKGGAARCLALPWWMTSRICGSSCAA